jgi:hypothetical protein
VVRSKQLSEAFPESSVISGYKLSVVDFTGPAWPACARSDTAAEFSAGDLLYAESIGRLRRNLTRIAFRRLHADYCKPTEPACEVYLA